VLESAFFWCAFDVEIDPTVLLVAIGSGEPDFLFLCKRSVYLTIKEIRKQKNENRKG